MIKEITSNGFYYKHFKLRVWDVTANSLGVRQIPKLVGTRLETLSKAKVQIRPSKKQTEILMENIPINLKQSLFGIF